jgi:lipoprotein-releasing system permease protein
MKELQLILDITKTHLISRYKQSLVAALGVTFGIGTFIIMMSFMTGLNSLLDGLILNRTPHIHIFNEIKPSETQAIDITDKYKDKFNIIRSVKAKQSQIKIHNALALIDQLKDDERVLGVSPHVQTNVFYLSSAVELNGIVTGIDVQAEDRLFQFGDYIVEGEPEALIKNKQGVLLGSGIMDKLSLEIGDRIQVSTAEGILFPLKVFGVFQSGLAEVDNIQSYVNLNTAQQLRGEGKSYITDINVKLHDMALAPAMAEFISDKFKLTAIDIKTANAQFDTGTYVRNLITYAVSITLLIVAGFGIYNILNMLIYEKMNDIAILKATGFSGKDIQSIFISQALIIGLIGGALGLILGYLVSLLISHTPFDTEALPTVETYPVNFNPLYYIIGIVFALVSTFLAGFLPSLKAKHIDPVEIIRKQ